MLKIRLQRVGRKHEPSFRLVVTDSENSTKSGRLLEVVGFHDFRGKAKTEIQKERVLHWISKGVQPTPSVHNLLITEKIITGKKINVLPKKTVAKPEVTETPTEAAPAPAPEAAPVAEAPAPEEKPAE